MNSTRPEVKANIQLYYAELQQMIWPESHHFETREELLAAIEDYQNKESQLRAKYKIWDF